MGGNPLEKMLQRERRKVELLETMIEEKTRDLYVIKEEVEEHNEFLNTVIESLPYPFYVVNADDLTVRMGNSAARACASSEGTAGAGGCQCRYCDTETGRIIRESKEKKRPVVAEHACGDHEDGATYYEVYTCPVFDGDGNVVQVIFYSQDITERKRAERSLQESEERFRSLAENTSDWIWEVDENDIYIYASPKVKDLLGYDPEEVIGRTPFDLMPPEEAGRASREFGMLKESRAPFSMLENICLHKDGRPVSLETGGVPVIDKEGCFRGYRGIDRDITERKAMDEDNKRQMAKLAALRAIDKVIIGSLDLEIALDVIIDQTIGQLGVDAADVLLYKPHLEILEYAAGRGFVSEALRHTRLKLGDSHAGRAALERRTVHVPDVRAESGEEGFRRSDHFHEEGFVFYYGVPLIAKGELQGILEVFGRDVSKHDREWLDFLEALAGQAAIAIDNGTLFNSLQRANTELALTYDETIEGLSRALDLRDKETEGHSQRVAELTLKIADIMGISETEQAHMRRGALLHDIGKMGIPDSILLKNGPLDDEEWKVMRTHPVLGYELLFPIKFLRPALDIPYYHHEKWDGTGYPQGLKKEHIPLAARIFAMVDIFDALSSDRPYRAAWPRERVLEHLASLSGSHLDPMVVDAFFKLDEEATSR